jgi:hypothetical protein
VHEEEEVRIKEYDYIRDLFKKFIYSLEQTSLNNLQKNEILKDLTQAVNEQQATTAPPGNISTRQANHQKPSNTLDSSDHSTLPNLL